VTNAHANIEGNSIVNVLDWGIVVNSYGYDQMSAQVIENAISPGKVGYPNFWGNGIGNQGAPNTMIAKNTLNITNPYADGMYTVDADGVSIIQNAVSMENSIYGAITLYDNSTHTVVSGNKIRGNGAAGFLLWGYGPEYPVENNTFVGNNINGFTPDPSSWGFAAHYLFIDANNNLVVGNGGQVIDLGQGNIITGLTPVAGEIGQALKEALANKKDVISQFK
jgi:hypothetical protein